METVEKRRCITGCSSEMAATTRHQLQGSLLPRTANVATSTAATATALVDGAAPEATRCPSAANQATTAPTTNPATPRQRPALAITADTL